ncbi:helix-turn-helix domain-containing protein [Streptomyces sp. NBC_00024]|uniref:helix-turn-helix domain-containing protein n=1 Tax=Streptomyces sp. NBC_00024 TaxID=2903612 RepID=UPI00324810A6
MTTPATARPTPAALARRPAPKPPSPAESIAPGVLVGKERMRTMIERGMRISRLHPEARLVALTLLGYAHHKTGIVFPRFKPTPEQLAEATGLTVGQVSVQIHVLTQRGWLCTRRITQGHDTGRAALSLAIPALVLEQVRAARAAEQPASATG